MSQPNQYVYKNVFLKQLIPLFDWFGRILFKFSSRKRPASFSHILVIRLDHIGDSVISEPFLRFLKKQYTSAKITFLVSPAAAEVYKKITNESRIHFDQLVEFDALWFGSSASPLACLKKWFSLIKTIGDLNCDCIFDLRGDIRHIVASRLASSKGWLIGFGITGGGFLLNEQAQFSTESHVVKRCLNLINEYSDDIAWNAAPSPMIAAMPMNESVIQDLPRKETPWVALHVGAGAEARCWPLHHWENVIKRLYHESEAHFFWIGDKLAKDKTQIIMGKLYGIDRSRFHDFCQKVTLDSLGTFLKNMNLLITPNSGPMHIASAHNIPTLVVFSGTDMISQWGPVHRNAKVLQQSIECSPCFQKFCPKSRHDCMEDLLPDDVVRESLSILASGSVAS